MQNPKTWKIEMKTMLLFLCTLFLCSCASVNEKYYCKKLENSNIEKCLEKGGILSGYYSKDKGWIIEPNLVASKYYKSSKRLFFKEKDAEFFSVIILGSSEKREVTPFISLLQPSYSLYESTVGPAVLGLKIDRSAVVLDEDTGETSRVIPNLDYNTKNEFGETIPALISNFTGGFWARHNENGNKYYRYYLNSGTEWTGKKTFPANKVRVIQTLNRLILMEILDESKRLYWPIIKMSTSYVEKPVGVKGLHLREDYNWLRYSLGGGVRIPTVSTVYYEIQKDDKTVYRANNLVPYKWNNSLDFSKFFAEIPESASTFTELKYFKLKHVSANAEIYEKDIITLKDSGGHYVSILDNNKFDTEEKLKEHLNQQNANIASAVADKKIQNKKYEEEKRIRDAELAESVRRERQKLIDEQAQAKAARRARIKAESDAAWSGVSDQLQNRARKADAKADCINKRTKKKQNFLDKKQNWYQDYDC